MHVCPIARYWDTSSSVARCQAYPPAVPLRLNRHLCMPYTATPTTAETSYAFRCMRSLAPVFMSIYQTAVRATRRNVLLYLIYLCEGVTQTRLSALLLLEGQPSKWYTYNSDACWCYFGFLTKCAATRLPTIIPCRLDAGSDSCTTA